MAEVQTAGDGDHWSTNSLVFATREEAERYVDDLMFRWTAVRDTRVVEVDQPVNSVWNPETSKRERVDGPQ
jgi:hypothetical protein